eukprot:scaffold2351_cov84-Skeletonema_dohrnii-CCMP3373.AAC.1
MRRWAAKTETAVFFTLIYLIFIGRHIYFCILRLHAIHADMTLVAANSQLLVEAGSCFWLLAPSQKNHSDVIDDAGSIASETSTGNLENPM